MGSPDVPDKRKILRVIARLNIGGPAHHVVLLSNALNDERWESLLVVGKPAPSEGDASYLLGERPCRTVTVPELQRSLNPFKDMAACWKLLRILLKERPDILHTHTAKAGTLGRCAGIAYRLITGRSLKTVHTFHGHVLQGYFHPMATRFFLGVERWLARRTDRLITVSHAVREELLGFRIGEPSTIRVIRLGLDLRPLLGLKEAVRENPIRIGFVGRLVPIKNPGLFLESIRRLRNADSLPSIDVMIAGDGELRTSLEEASRSLGLKDIIRFAGWERDLPSLYSSLDIVCLTSRNEGTPVSLIEALAAARPVIATDVGGVRELLGEGGAAQDNREGFRICPHGLLVRSDDPDGFARALRFLIQQPQLRLQMGRSGRAFVQDQFLTERLVRDIRGLYEELASDLSSC